MRGNRCVPPALQGEQAVRLGAVGFGCGREGRWRHKHSVALTECSKHAQPGRAVKLHCKRPSLPPPALMLSPRPPAADDDAGDQTSQNSPASGPHPGMMPSRVSGKANCSKVGG